jgi:hypothetical protein
MAGAWLGTRVGPSQTAAEGWGWMLVAAGRGNGLPHGKWEGSLEGVKGNEFLGFWLKP